MLGKNLCKNKILLWIWRLKHHLDGFMSSAQTVFVSRFATPLTSGGGRSKHLNLESLCFKTTPLYYILKAICKKMWHELRLSLRALSLWQVWGSCSKRPPVTGTVPSVRATPEFSSLGTLVTALRSRTASVEQWLHSVTRLFCSISDYRFFSILANIF